MFVFMVLLWSRALFYQIECKEGWFGQNCSQLCSRHCRDDAFCNHMTGQCEKGCDFGWTGYICEKGNYLLFLFSFTIKVTEFLMLI